MSRQKAHSLIIAFPLQGHINPGLQFAKRLLNVELSVTFVTCVSAYRRIDKSSIPNGLELVTFSDGYDDGFQRTNGDARNFMTQFRQRGIESMTEIFHRSRDEGRPVTCLVYTLALQWAAEVARGFDVPSALLWVQPASVFDMYYYYFRGYGEVIGECEKDPSWSLELPNVPLTLKARDLPTFLLPSTPEPYTSALPALEQQIVELEKEETPTILVNTFEALEVEALMAIERFTLIPVGPLLPSAFLDRKDPEDKSFGGDLFKGATEEDYMRWLDSKSNSSVIYVSFGSISVLSKAQMEELAQALIQTHRPFLWVIRANDKDKNQRGGNEEEDSELSCMEELKQQGMIVPWCSQVDVLSHPSVGCFLTHSGWNSTLESLTCGVPMAAVPQRMDQMTNAKMVQDLWKTGVRVNESEDGVIVKSEEIKRCLEMVMGSEEIRENAKKWSDLALQAAREGGSSDKNLKAFIERTQQSGKIANPA